MRSFDNVPILPFDSTLINENLICSRGNFVAKHFTLFHSPTTKLMQTNGALPLTFTRFSYKSKSAGTFNVIRHKFIYLELAHTHTHILSSVTLAFRVYTWNQHICAFKHSHSLYGTHLKAMLNFSTSSILTIIDKQAILAWWIDTMYLCAEQMTFRSFYLAL